MIELVAGRILAPYVGVSLYTWTSIIGVVLAGISIGAWAGGWVADRWPRSSTLGLLLLASGVTALLIAPFAGAIGTNHRLQAALGIAQSLPMRVVLLSSILFFLPSFFLGMISPVAVKLAVGDLEKAGRVVGRIYAFSTLGAIVGTFTTGFYLVAKFGTKTTMIGVGAVLIASAFLFGDLLGRWGRIGSALFIATVALLMTFGTRTFRPPYRPHEVSATDTGRLHLEESQYYTIEVEQTVDDDDGRPLQALRLDHLVHSFSDMKNPAYLHYRYLEMFHDVIRWRARQSPIAKLMFIGGGGYTLPRFTEISWPGVEIDVIEIDPAVTRVAHQFFGLPRDSAIRTFNEDARWFAMRSQEKYDLIFIDAFNDLSVPYHLTTREFTEELRKDLAPDGAVVVNLIDNFEQGRFLASYTKTLQSVFGERNVAIMVESELDMADVQSTYVVIASPVLERILQFDRKLTDPPAPAGRPIPHVNLMRYLRERDAIVLTDDYVPVDNMLAPLFAQRFDNEVN